MGKRIWTIEEEKIVCGVFLDTKKCGIWAADLVNEELMMNGIEPRKISSITAKLGDYKKIDERGDLSHVAPKSIRVYASLYKSKSINFEGLDRFISNLNSDSKFEETITLELDALKRSNFIDIPGLPKPTRDNKDYRLNFSNYFKELIKP